MNTNSDSTGTGSPVVNNTAASTPTPPVKVKKVVGRKKGVVSLTDISYSDIVNLGLDPSAKITVGFKWLSKIKNPASAAATTVDVNA